MTWESPYAIGYLYRDDGIHKVTFWRNFDGSYSTRQHFVMNNGDFLEVGTFRLTFLDGELITYEAENDE